MQLLGPKSEWSALLSDCNLHEGEKSDQRFNELCAAYSEPHRSYHTLAHVSNMLMWINQAQVGEPAVRWATWYHDISYHPERVDNEEQSAALAKAVLKEFGVEDDIVANVVAMIMATKNHCIPEGSGTGVDVFLDADMAILGSGDEDYADYCQAVRKEYESIPESLYTVGRRNFLESVLAQERIYLSAWFSERFERKARENIGREIVGLTVC